MAINYTKPQPLSYVHAGRTTKASRKGSYQLAKGECVSLTQLAKAAR